MANFLPPPPPWWTLSPPPPPLWWAWSPAPPWRYTPYTDESSSTSAGIIAAISMPIAMIFLLVLICFCAIARRPPEPPSVAEAAADEPRDNNDEEQQLRGDDCRGPRPAGPATAGLPSFTYTLSLKHNVTGTGHEEVATCSVCLGALEVGETVRLLPVCMHLYHVECIDPWLVAHSTCPICRSGTMDQGPRLPPV